MDKEKLQEVFTYHPPTEDSRRQYDAIRNAGFEFAKVILENVPPSADRTDAIRKVREAVMVANAAVALEGLI